MVQIQSVPIYANFTSAVACFQVFDHYEPLSWWPLVRGPMSPLAQFVNLSCLYLLISVKLSFNFSETKEHKLVNDLTL